MLRILTASSLIALASAASLAQTGPMDTQVAPQNANRTEPATPATPAMPATPNAGEPATRATPATPATPAEPSTGDASDPEPQPAPAPTAEPKEVTVQKLVDAEFPTYDINKNDELEPAEFRKWVLALHDASGEANAAKDPSAKAKWANAAFATADTDKSKKVTKAEMNSFLLS